MGLLILLTEVVCKGFYEKIGSILGICWYFRRGGLDQISPVVSEGRLCKLLHKKQLLLRMHNN